MIETIDYTAPSTKVTVVRISHLLLISNAGDNEGFNKDNSPYNGGWDDEA